MDQHCKFCHVRTDVPLSSLTTVGCMDNDTCLHLQIISTTALLAAVSGAIFRGKYYNNAYIATNIVRAKCS
jgi:hypothetical protein